MYWVRTARRIFHGDHQTFFARTLCQVFRQELRYLSLLCYQRGGHETCQHQKYFRELHKLTFRLTDAISMRSFALVGTSPLRVVPHAFLFGAQPIFDVVAVLPAT
jgi:hypothetical protein